MDDLVDEASASGAARVQSTPAQDQVQRALQTDQSRQALGATAGWQEAQVHFGLAEYDARRLGNDAIVARQGELETATQGRAVDGGDRGTRQPRQLVTHRLK